MNFLKFLIHLKFYKTKVTLMGFFGCCNIKLPTALDQIKQINYFKTQSNFFVKNIFP